MTRRAVACVLATMLLGALVVPTLALGARTGVTIHHKHKFTFYGYVFSPKPQQCAKARKVRLFKQKGKRQNRQRDLHINSSSAVHKVDGKYKWTANLRDPRFKHGRYYARVGKIPGCRRDTSRTIEIDVR